MNRIYLFFIPLALLCITSCATRRVASEPLQVVDPLTPEEHRLFDYLYLAAEGYRMQEQSDVAFDLYRQAARIDTLNAAVKFQLANYYVQMNRPLIAVDYLRDAVQIEPNNFWYGSLLASLLQHMQQTDEAIVVAQDLVERHPKQVQINYMLAELYGTKGELPQAVVALDRVEEVMGRSEALSVAKYRIHRANNDEQSAFAEIEELAAAFPSQASYQLLLGELYLGAGRTAESLAAYNKAELLEPNSVYVILAKVNYYKTVRDTEAYRNAVHKALQSANIDATTKTQLLVELLPYLAEVKAEVATTYALFPSLLEMHPDAVELRRLYTRVLLTEQQLDEAVAVQQALLAIDPSEVTDWLQLMRILLAQEEYQQVLNTGEQALVHHSHDLDIYYLMSITASIAEDYEESIALLERAIEQAEPEQQAEKSTLYGQIGDTYHQWGDKEQAYEAYDKALELNPNNVNVLNNYSYFLSLESKDLRKAEQMSGRAVELEPKNPTYLDTYAWVFFQQGNYMLAKIYLQSAITYGGEKSADILEHYGDALYMNDDLENAVIYWKKALLLNDSSELLRQKIDEQRYLEL